MDAKEQELVNSIDEAVGSFDLVKESILEHLGEHGETDYKTLVEAVRPVDAWDNPITGPVSIALNELQLSSRIIGRLVHPKEMSNRSKIYYRAILRVVVFV